MGKKIIFLDIDGTLTIAGTNVPPDSALKVIRAAQAKGHLVFLCTGRNYDMLRPLLSYGFDGVVASAGGYVTCGNEVIFDSPMTKEQQQLVLQTLEENGIYRTVECLDGSFTDDGFKEFLEEHVGHGANSELLRWRRQLEEELNIRSMREYKGQPVYKVVIMSPDLSRMESAKKKLEQDFLFCLQDADRYGIVNGEVINRQFDKGQAVIRVCNYLDISVHDSIGFGDSMNDKEMMETVGYSVCMENGSQALKEIADEICPSVEQDGLYHAFIKLGLA
ncbi:MAG: HAD family hydrolase [Lachnospiraceae bacterium]|nr:HAD family hydrolase [Lachnospiraceae bacterium]